MTKDKRISIIATQLEAGGAQRLALWQQEVLADYFEVKLCFLYFKSPFMGRGDSSCLSSNGDRSLLNLVKIYFRLAGFLLGQKVVIAHTHFSILMALAVKLTVNQRIKIVAVHHSERSLYGPTTSKLINSRYAKALVFKNVFVAPHISEGANSVVISNPLIAASGQKTLEGAKEDPDILFVGRLSSEKRLDDLIRAVGNSPERSLTVIGDGRIRDELVSLALMVTSNNQVRFIGAKSPEEVREYMKSCNVLVIPSNSEALPLVLLEGLASQCSVICSRIPAHKFAIDSRLASSFEPGDISSLTQLLNVRIHPTPSEESIKKALRPFDPEHIRAQWVELLLSATSRNYAE